VIPDAPDRRLSSVSERTTRLSYPDPPLSDGVVRLRRWAETDIACVEAASSDPEIPESTTIPASFSEAEGLAWITRQGGRAENGEGLSLAITDARTDEALGAAVLMFRTQPGTVGLGYWLIPHARGRRLASYAVALLAPWALREAGIARIEAIVELGNTPSQRVLEAAGFKREGLLRSYLVFGTRRADAYIYSLVPNDIPDPA
jgi:ribosomal-protein-alanine N-acetyltransferase